MIAMIPNLLPTASPSPANSTYLKFSLTPPISAALPLASVREVFLLPRRRLIPLPNLPGFVLGLFAQGNRIYGALDLRRRLEMTAAPQSLQEYPIILLQFEEKVLGLAVSRIENVVRISPEEIQPPSSRIPPAAMPFLQGCLGQSCELWFLDAQAILTLAITPSLCSF
ncbi:MAG: hypothetical protein HC890_11515 [Chloroflexaceae bacterium]|nr:hypothetical protein [Chloroflexaceae bacterium]